MKIPPGWGLPVELRIHIGDRGGHQRELEADGHLVLILHRVPETKSRAREPVYFWKPPEHEWRASGRGAPKAQLMKLVEEYELTVLRLSEMHEAGETASQIFAVLEHITPVTRAIRNLTETLRRARRIPEDQDARRDLQQVLDLAQEVTRNAELLQNDARHALDYQIAMQSEIQARHSREVERATHRLNAMAAVFLPLTAVASVFGMNLRSGLEESPAWIFWLVLVGGIAAGLFVSEILTAVKLRGQNSG